MKSICIHFSLHRGLSLLIAVSPSTDGEDGQDTSGYCHRCIGPTHKHVLETSGRSQAVHGVSAEPQSLTQPLRQQQSPPNPTPTGVPSRAPPERADERQSRGKRTCGPTRHSPSGNQGDANPNPKDTAPHTCSKALVTRQEVPGRMWSNCNPRALSVGTETVRLPQGKVRMLLPAPKTGLPRDRASSSPVSPTDLKEPKSGPHTDMRRPRIHCSSVHSSQGVEIISVPVGGENG